MVAIVATIVWMLAIARVIGSCARLCQVADGELALLLLPGLP